MSVSSSYGLDELKTWASPPQPGSAGSDLDKRINPWPAGMAWSRPQFWPPGPSMHNEASDSGSLIDHWGKEEVRVASHVDDA